MYTTIQIRDTAMFSHFSLYVVLVRAVFALQVPRQANTSYTNSSALVTATTSAALGPVCCEVYAASVVLNYWYTGHIASVNNGTLVTKYMKYNGTCSHAFHPQQTTNVDSRAMSSGKTCTVPLHRMLFKLICRLNLELC